MTHPIHIAYCQSPLGLLEIHASAAGIHAVHFPDVMTDRDLAGKRHTDFAETGLHTSPFKLLRLESDSACESLLQAAVSQLTEYFAGQRSEFMLPLAATGTTFQHQVWRQLAQIPYGQTESYGDLATKIGNKKAMRAVGAANGRNPIAIIVPCHRVIGADGKLTGYAGGLTRKIWLLQHEQRNNMNKATT